jgi:hypothetical protein
MYLIVSKLSKNLFLPMLKVSHYFLKKALGLKLVYSSISKSIIIFTARKKLNFYSIYLLN